MISAMTGNPPLCRSPRNKIWHQIFKNMRNKVCSVASTNNNLNSPKYLFKHKNSQSHLYARVVDEILAKAASSINDIDKKGNAPLHLAALHGHRTVIKALLALGAAVNDRNTKLQSPLDCAAINGHVAAAEALLEGGASVDPLYKHAMTPLHLAAMEGHAGMVKLLLQSCDISLSDASGRNCLDLAIDYGRK